MTETLEDQFNSKSWQCFCILSKVRVPTNAVSLNYFSKTVYFTLTGLAFLFSESEGVVLRFHWMCLKFTVLYKFVKTKICHAFVLELCGF